MIQYGKGKYGIEFRYIESNEVVRYWFEDLYSRDYEYNAWKSYRLVKDVKVIERK